MAIPGALSKNERYNRESDRIIAHPTIRTVDYTAVCNANALYPMDYRLLSRVDKLDRSFS